MNKTLRFQQGDVLFLKVDQVPADSKLTTKQSVITLVEGETTGHAHRLQNWENTSELYVKDGVMYLDIQEDKQDIIHEEHDTIVLEKGTYEIGRIREYDYQSEQWWYVSD